MSITKDLNMKGKSNDTSIDILIKTIKEKPYQTVTVKVHEGKIARIIREESIKVDSNK